MIKSSSQVEGFCLFFLWSGEAHQKGVPIAQDHGVPLVAAWSCQRVQ